MSDDELDAYDNPAPIGPVGENVATFHEDGSVSVEKRPPEDRSSVRKDAKRIAALSDDRIREMGTRERSGIVDYAIDGVSVSFRGIGFGAERAYLCHTHVVNECPHTRRVQRYREEH